MAQRREGLHKLESSAPSALLARREAALLAAELGWIDRELKLSPQGDNKEAPP